MQAEGAFYHLSINIQGLPEILNISMNYIATVNSSYATGFYSKHGQTEGYYIVVLYLQLQLLVMKMNCA